MTAADRAEQRPANARLLVVDPSGCIVHAPRAHWHDFLQRGDLAVANDAATLPASLQGVHRPTGRPVELRLAAWRSHARADIVEVDAVVFGSGDYRMRTEDRPPPPSLAAGDVLALGAMETRVSRVLDHPRLVRLRFGRAEFWHALATHGRPIQYSHLRAPLQLWDVWTPFAAVPVAFEPPSAGFVIDWRALASLRARGIRFATLTHAAGLSSTGDAELDRRLPLDEPYRISVSTAQRVAQAKRDGARVIAIGTTVVRALEHAARIDGVARNGDGVATQRIGARTRLRVVDGLMTGTHEPGSSHHELLRAFAGDSVLARAAAALEQEHYRTHEFGDSMLVFYSKPPALRNASAEAPVSIATNVRARSGSCARLATAAE
jgi:S-adenosylmethionine:tRNA ribosyltransferase-isomerase